MSAFCAFGVGGGVKPMKRQLLRHRVSTERRESARSAETALTTCRTILNSVDIEKCIHNYFSAASSRSCEANVIMSSACNVLINLWPSAPANLEHLRSRQRNHQMRKPARFRRIAALKICGNIMKRHLSSKLIIKRGDDWLLVPTCFVF